MYTCSCFTCEDVFAEKAAFLSSSLVLTYEGGALYIFMYTIGLDLSGCFSWKSCNWIYHSFCQLF